MSKQVSVNVKPIDDRGLVLDEQEERFARISATGRG